MKYELIKQGYIPIRLTIIKTLHLVIKAKINGIEGFFVVDTGASNTCVGIEFAEYFGLKKKLSEIKASGAGAVDIETHLSKNNLLTIGKWSKHSVNLILFDLSHINQALILYGFEPLQGIIGADILKKHKAIIDYSQKILYLLK
ncbi:retropepsin-like aspartic protease family protein [Capnocytophaga catalasegens]|uniref:Acid protease n=1 Tax=Capnocytophaga catalasegens TaxID=1004260 RepID=A0AAV5AUW6_9FLAO|nr:retropepsin-like aspartic protease [Capnocytophaga catalasegens]GIZ15468.1 hypothetical protein RCZ03_14680 [Capnocytophaga catalasegens]GJM51056.1 hypothetical protein RCZ15_20290 [Capnocytophaga catalasegens]GJM52241.1 hypothetical protein RCZ16_05590 [Capnocytophaga catalasegens]